MRSVIDVPDLTPEELDALMDTAEDIIARPEKYSEACHGKKLATLCFEPSTRTRLSFARPFHATRISLPCAIPRKARRWWQPAAPLCR